MKASFLDLRKKTAEIIRALERNERVTVFYRGRARAVMEPLPQQECGSNASAIDHASFGVWRDRADLDDMAATLREMRKGRVGGL